MTGPTKPGAENERDPRVDPKPGDVLRCGKTGIRKVEYVGPIAGKTPGVAWRVPGHIRWVCMDWWKRWAAKADVIHSSGEEK